MYDRVALAVAVATVPIPTAVDLAAAPSTPRVATACDANTATSLVRTFVAAFNHGQAVAAAKTWAHEPAFQWFSANPPGKRLGSAAYDRASLTVYFRSRARVHELLKITQFKAGYDPNRNIVNFAGKLIRTSRDVTSALEKDFKGVAACERQANLDRLEHVNLAASGW
jgi:hypothetical protein